MAADELRESAPAKVNLTLRVRGRRVDGYHDLESLVAFASIADALALAPGRPLSLRMSGPMAEAAGSGEGNLVLKAARALIARRPGLATGRFHLVKRLPVAAGLGGGSSDAAAALRLLGRLNGLAEGHPDLRGAARAVGADVPACLARRPQLMTGIGDELAPVPSLPSLPAVLVNAGTAMPTSAVFSALGLVPGALTPPSVPPQLPHGSDPQGWLAWLAQGRNDLEPPAMRLSPTVGDALARLRGEAGCRLARMSGSGATVFGLFATRREADAAAKAIRSAEPGWWVEAAWLGDGREISPAA